MILWAHWIVLGVHQVLLLHWLGLPSVMHATMENTKQGLGNHIVIGVCLDFPIRTWGLSAVHSVCLVDFPVLQGLLVVLIVHLGNIKICTKGPYAKSVS